MKTFRIGVAMLALAPLLGGCVVAQVTGAAVNTTGAVVSSAARTTGAAARAVIPGDGEGGGEGESASYR